jgi:predicted nucleic acid-binding protein
LIAADSSSLIAHFAGDRGPDTDLLARAFLDSDLALPPVVLTELLTDPRVPAKMENELINLLTLDIREGYWLRAGHSRRLLRQHGLKAKLADSLIAQACIDHDVALITRDRDFRHFQKHCGLRLA